MTTETPDISPEVKDLLAKVNSLTEQLDQERKARVLTEKVAKINALAPGFKAESNMSADFLDGVHWAYSNPIKPAEKSNALPPTPTTGTPRTYHTPDGKEPGAKPLTVFKGFENEPVEGF